MNMNVALLFFLSECPKNIDTLPLCAIAYEELLHITVAINKATLYQG